MNHKPFTPILLSALLGFLFISALWLLLSKSARAIPATTQTLNPVVQGVTVATHLASATSSYTLSLPIILRPHGSLYGSVFENGVRAPGITVTLFHCRRYDGTPSGPSCSDWQFLYTMTDNNGLYEFVDMPTLGIADEQTYQIWWENDLDNPKWLAQWRSRTLDSYFLGDRVNISNFDISNVELSAPISGTVSALPTTFQWVRRTSIPSDNYALCLIGGMYWPGRPPIIWDQIGCNEPLGYTDSFVLATHYDIDYGYAYEWIVQVFDSSGGEGISYETNAIMFMNP